MLVLSRSVGQKIIIGEDIVLTVVAIEGNQVRLGIEAPETVPILRQELDEQAEDRLPALITFRPFTAHLQGALLLNLIKFYTAKCQVFLHNCVLHSGGNR